MELGTLTITGEWPMEIDGLFLGYTRRHSTRFKWTDKGFVRKNKLYKTQDPGKLIEALGIQNAKYTLSVGKRIKRETAMRKKNPIAIPALMGAAALSGAVTGASFAVTSKYLRGKSTTETRRNPEKGYHGWKNYETWNVALWMGSDEFWHNVAKESLNYKEFKNRMIYWHGIMKTPDGVSLRSKKLDRKALSNAIIELGPGKEEIIKQREKKRRELIARKKRWRKKLEERRQKTRNPKKFIPEKVYVSWRPRKKVYEVHTAKKGGKVLYKAEQLSRAYDWIMKQAKRREAEVLSRKPAPKVRGPYWQEVAGIYDNPKEACNVNDLAREFATAENPD